MGINFNRKRLQVELGDNYFVPRVFFFKRKTTEQVCTLSTWVQHIPNVFPPADYYHLHRKRRKLFRIVTDAVLISRETLLREFSLYMTEFKWKNCKIIHPTNAALVEKKFNTIQPDISPEEVERLEIENLYNAKP